jgi:ribosome-binding protein aMBF1 (putative translation factor)
MTVLACPSCSEDMQERRRNHFTCPRCKSRFIQEVIDTRPYRHKIIEARQRVGLSVEETADRLSVTAIHYKRVEYGSSNLSARIKSKLAKIFKCQAEDLE